VAGGHAASAIARKHGRENSIRTSSTAAASTAPSRPNTRTKQDTVYTVSITEAEAILKKSAERNGGYEETVIDGNIVKIPVQNQNENIRIFADNIFTATEKLHPISEEDKNGIYTYKCSTTYSEAEAAASIVLSLMREGYRCRDIVVIMRDADSYRGIIEPAFERCGVPFYFS
jgi:ATP-dependent helicase/DNAse subunit B